MLLKEIKKAPGTYAGVKFDDDTVNNINKYIEENNIPNPVQYFHTTLLYSRENLPKYQPISYDTPLKGKITEIKNLGDDKTIVIMFDCPELSKRHSELRKEHNAPWDFPEYIPHVTLSYDAKDINVNKLTLPKFPINITKEYAEELT